MVRPVVQRGPADCVRACLCTLLGVEPEELAEIDPDRWWIDGSEAVRRFGLALVEASPAYLLSPHLRHVHWIGLVPSHFRPGGHAIVLRGDEVIHDPARSEPRYTTETAADAARRNALGAALLVAADPSLIVDLRHG